MKEKKMSRISKFRLIRVRCKKCGHQFFPHGMVPIIPGALGKYTCPYCGKKQTIIHDMELQREFARKELGLDKELKDEVRRIELEYQELKTEIDWLKKQVEDNTEAIKELETTIGKKIVDTKKQLSKEIAQILGERTKKKPAFKPI